MRLFIAAELPDGALEALAETSARLRGAVRGRYVAPDSFHVTLAFLGDVEGARIDAAAGALEEGCLGVGSFGVSLGGLGSFGRRSKATLWQGFDEAGALFDLATATREALRLRSFTFDEKKFLPHVTLMRAANLAAGTLPAPACASGIIDTVTLFHSDLSDARPMYEPLHSVYLGEW